MNIFKVIKRDHKKQRELMNLLVENHKDTAKQDRVFKHVKLLLQTYEDTEEKNLLSQLINKNKTQEKSNHSIAKHKEIDDLVQYLEKTDYRTADWLVMAKKLKQKVEHYIGEKENKFFRQAEKVLSDKQKKSFALAYKKTMKNAIINQVKA